MNLDIERTELTSDIRIWIKVRDSHMHLAT